MSADLVDHPADTQGPNTKPSGEVPPPAPQSRKPSWRVWIMPLAGAAFMAWSLVRMRSPPLRAVSYTELYAFVEQGKVASVALSGLQVSGKFKQDETVGGKNGRDFETALPQQDDHDLLPLLRAQHVDVEVRNEHTSLFEQVALSFLPWVLIFGGWLWLSRRMQKSGSGLPFGGMAARPRRVEQHDGPRVCFDDVAGLSGAKGDLREVVDFLREPGRFRRLGGKLPRGVLLVGPPGTGKTLLARAVAGEADVPFFYVNGSEFIQLFVGVGAQRVRELFDEAKKAGPSIVFIDEIDAVGRSRGTGLGGGNDEREQTLNQLLSELDGFTRNDLTVVLAATNRPDVLDPALLRPGRFDRRVVIDRPENKAREAILHLYTKDKPLAPDVAIDELATSTPGFSGADLANLCNEAALTATRRDAEAIHATDFAAAMDKIVLGDPRETLLDPEERRRVAVHESGHAIVARFTADAEPLRRVSILPRGFALGATQQTAAPDRHIVTQPQLEAKLGVLMGGYAAESLLLGNVSSGSESDLRSATDLAFTMVAHYGMSKRVGPVFHEQRLEHPFLGERLATETGVSEATSSIIEDEVRRALAEALDSATRSIEHHREALTRLIAALLEHETMEKSALDAVLGEDKDAWHDASVCAHALTSVSHTH
jgi:cell division protease FtsH